MNPTELRVWLETHAGDIFMFMDYEVMLLDDDEFRRGSRRITTSLRP